MDCVAAPEKLDLIDGYVALRREKDPKYRKKDLAAEAGVSTVALHRIQTGDSAVSPALLDKIEAATDGAIKAVDLFAEWHAKRNAARSEPPPAPTPTQAPPPLTQVAASVPRAPARGSQPKERATGETQAAPAQPKPKVSKAATKLAAQYVAVARGSG
jgi:DNA-binding transcriptional regulator YdaS (Cro superfamily)